MPRGSRRARALSGKNPEPGCHRGRGGGESKSSGGVAVGKREGGKVGSGGGCENGAAICSTLGFFLLFALAVEMFPGEMRRVCVDLFV